MRAYYFGNMYLSSIQQGIQAAHATHELFTRWSEPSVANSTLFDWAENHKTMILLNGGYAATIQELVDFFSEQGEHVVSYPWAEFREEEASLNGALTTVGIVLSEKIYVAASLARPYRSNVLEGILEDGSLVVAGKDNSTGEIVTWDYTKWEYNLVKKLNGFGLAS